MQHFDSKHYTMTPAEQYERGLLTDDEMATAGSVVVHVGHLDCDVTLMCEYCGRVVRRGDNIDQTYRPNGCDHWYLSARDGESEHDYTTER